MHTPAEGEQSMKGSKLRRQTAAWVLMPVYVLNLITTFKVSDAKATVGLMKP